MEFTNHKVRLDHAINSVDCGEHPFMFMDSCIFSLNIIFNNAKVFFLMRRGVRVVEGARLESVCPEQSGPWVRIPPSPF